MWNRVRSLWSIPAEMVHRRVSQSQCTLSTVSQCLCEFLRDPNGWIDSIESRVDGVPQDVDMDRTRAVCG
jgi:hypothetical protein